MVCLAWNQGRRRLASTGLVRYNSPPMRGHCVTMFVFMFAAMFGLAACPSGVPSHSGYKRKQPWKKAKRIKFKEGKTTAEITGSVSFPKRRRARWYKLTLDGASEVKLKFEVTPADDEDEFELPLEVLDPSFRVISKTEPDDDEYGALTKEKELFELRPGTYYLHIYTLHKLDEAEFTLTIEYKLIADDTPVTPLLPEQPLVPVIDPCGECQCGDRRCDQLCPRCKKATDPCKNCSCRRSRTCRASCSKCKRKPSRCSKCDCNQASCKSCRKCVTCDSCDCSESGCKRYCKQCKAGPEPTSCLTARVRRIVESGASTSVTLSKGSRHGVAVGWKAKFKGIGGTHRVSSVGETSSKVSVGATVDQVRAAGGRATLCP